MNEKVKQALENLKTIRFYVGACSEQVCEYFKQIEETLNDFDKYHESQQDLIKGKDEHIAKLLEENKIRKTIIHDKEQLIVNVSKELNDLREFAKIMSEGVYTEYRGQILIVNGNSKPVENKEQIEFIMKVVEKYGEEN